MLRGKYSLHVFHHEHRRPVIRDDSQIFLVKKMAHVVLKIRIGTPHARAPDKRICLAGWPADQHPYFTAIQSLTDEFFHLMLRGLTKFDALRLCSSSLGLPRIKFK